MELNFNRLTRYLILLTLGLIMIVYGLFRIGIDFSQDEMSDQEIMERARGLGMIEITEAYEKSQEIRKD